MVRHFRAASAPEQEAALPQQRPQPAQEQLQQIEDPWVARTLEHTLMNEASTSNRCWHCSVQIFATLVH